MTEDAGGGGDTGGGAWAPACPASQPGFWGALPCILVLCPECRRSWCWERSSSGRSGSGMGDAHISRHPHHPLIPALRPLCGHCCEPARDACLWASGGFLPKVKVTFGKEVSRARRL